MEARKTIVQKWKRNETQVWDVAYKYYALLSVVNGLNLTPRKLQLVTFTALKGNISYSTYRKEFIETYQTSSATINNMISELKELKVLVKDAGKIKVNPALLLNFENNLIIQISLNHG